MQETEVSSCDAKAEIQDMIEELAMNRTKLDEKIADIESDKNKRARGVPGGRRAQGVQEKRTLDEL